MRKFKRIIGPGIITGIADDDPSGIATYSQAGAKFGLNLLWMAIFMLPMQFVVQNACGRIGAVKGKGIAAVIKENYNKKVLASLVLCVLIANTINIGADIGAMAAAMQLIIPTNFVLLTIFFTVLTLVLEILICYKTYATYLKWLCLTLLAYPITIFIIQEPWLQLLKTTFVPYIELNSAFLFMVTAVIGTTISPYLFFWQASQEVEEERKKGLAKRHCDPNINSNYIKKIGVDTGFGMLFSQIGCWAIIVVTAGVLHKHGISEINTAADAAKALEPFVKSFSHSGYLAKLIFAIGIIGLGLLSVPILAGSAAYALGEALDWRVGLNLKFKSAQGFYAIIIVSMLIGLGLNFIGIDPMKLLVYAAVINGVASIPLLFMIAKLSQNKKVMGVYKFGLLSNLLIWITFIFVSLATFVMIYAFAHDMGMI